MWTISNYQQSSDLNNFVFVFSKHRVLVEASKYIEYVPYLYFFLEKPMLHQNPSIYIKLIELLLLLSVLMLSQLFIYMASTSEFIIHHHFFMLSLKKKEYLWKSRSSQPVVLELVEINKFHGWYAALSILDVGPLIYNLYGLIWDKKKYGHVFIIFSHILGVQLLTSCVVANLQLKVLFRSRLNIEVH